MRIQLVCQSKYRRGGHLGDDVPLVVPGQVYGVFDGATDARGTMVEGMGTGRLAALTVAGALADLAADPIKRLWPAGDIVAHLTQALAARNAPLDLPIPPSTTIAAALDCGKDWRFLLLGDSGIRLNGQEVLHQPKIIDTVSTTARVEVFRLLRERMDDLGAVELATRRAIFLGFDIAVAEAVLDRGSADSFIAAAIDATGLSGDAGTVADFLNGGIQSQYRFANATGSPLCFDSMNGTAPQLGHVIDETRPKNAVQSIEIFSDGYPDLPSEVTLDAWEASHAEAEARDFHSIGPFATVKGGTPDEYFDDRTIVLLTVEA